MTNTSRRTFELIRTLEPETNFYLLAISPDGKILVSSPNLRDEFGIHCPELNVWNLQTGKLQHALDLEGLEEVNGSYQQEITKLIISPDGQTLASETARYRGSGTYSNRCIQLWNLQTGEVQRILKDYSLHTFSPDAQTLVTSTEDGTIQFWHLLRSNLQRSLRIIPGTVEAIAFSSDAQILASMHLSDDFSSGNWSIKVWDFLSGNILHSFVAEVCDECIPPCLALSPDRRILACSDEYGISLWDLETGEMLPAPDTDRYPQFTFLSDGTLVIMTSYTQLLISFWNAGSGELEYQDLTELGTEMPAVCSADGSIFATSEYYGEEDSTLQKIKVWRVILTR